MSKLFTYLTLVFALLLTGCNTNSDFQVDNEKKPLTNDTELLISLLKRPTTADQIMMEQFEQTRMQTFQLQQVGYVMIKGPKSEKPAYGQHHLDWLYDQYDSNFVRLAGPTQKLR
ncbi:hypothetical protein ACFSJY_06125 [Thalassotalea euphylliae]|uniref:hypothetical protein n=1 Tax=Thalassotalea euphylliae TaxID=1655234 RepID=UPI003643B9B0